MILGLFLLSTALEIRHAAQEQLGSGHAGPRGRAKKCRKWLHWKIFWSSVTVTARREGKRHIRSVLTNRDAEIRVM